MRPSEHNTAASLLSTPHRACLSLALALLSALLTLTACGGAVSGEPTPTPLPTSSLPGLVTVPSRMCQVARLPMLRTEQPQGHMIDWAPQAHTLAYLAPSTASTWMVGTLMVVNGPAFAEPQDLVDYAAGHLTWSPQGSTLAYLSLRRSDSLYSINVVYPQSGESMDLFPGETARTDQWSSQKAILSWTDEYTLRVQVSCGLDCLQVMKVDLPERTLTLVGSPTQRTWDWWNYYLNQGPGLPEAYQEFVQQFNWAPDESRLVYLDDRSDAWVIVPAEQIQYPLPTGGYLQVTETDWSDDGQYLAVQAEDWLFIFEDCP